MEGPEAQSGTTYHAQQLLPVQPTWHSMESCAKSRENQRDFLVAGQQVVVCKCLSWCRVTLLAHYRLENHIQHYQLTNLIYYHIVKCNEMIVNYGSLTSCLHFIKESFSYHTQEYSKYHLTIRTIKLVDPDWTAVSLWGNQGLATMWDTVADWLEYLPCKAESTDGFKTPPSTDTA